MEEEDTKPVPLIVRLAATESPLLEDRIKNLTQICELLGCETNCESIKDALADITGIAKPRPYLIFNHGEVHWFTNYDEESWGVNDYYDRTPKTGASPDIHKAITNMRVVAQSEVAHFQVNRSSGIKIRDFAELLGKALRLDRSDPLKDQMDLDQVERE